MTAWDKSLHHKFFGNVCFKFLILQVWECGCISTMAFIWMLKNNPSCLSPSLIWVQGIELRLSSLKAHILTQ